MKKNRKIAIIINPIAGKVSPILPVLERSLDNTDIQWIPMITKNEGDEYGLTDKAVKDRVDIIAVYGGDGTVGKVAQALFKKKTPLYILPGGTANMLAQHFNIPLQVEDALDMLKQKKYQSKEIDMGLYNDKPFIAGISTGLVASAIGNTSRQAKNKFGFVSYLIPALTKVPEASEVTYRLILDGKEYQEQGVSILIVNIGSFTFAGIPLISEHNEQDSMFQVAVLKKSSYISLLKFAFLRLLRKKTRDSFPQWKASKVVISLHPSQKVMVDDAMVGSMKEMHIEVAPRTVTVLEGSV